MDGASLEQSTPEFSSLAQAPSPLDAQTVGNRAATDPSAQGFGLTADTPGVEKKKIKLFVKIYFS